jgi:5-methylcytosine-specific restriction enzyme B
LDRPGSPFHEKLGLVFNHFKGLYDPKYPQAKSMQVQLATLKNREQFELFMQKLSEFKEKLVSKGEEAAMQMNSIDSKQDEDHSEEPTQMQVSNLILYGPPGTGKTYELQQLFEQYMSKTGNETREIYLQRIVTDKSWFLVVAAAILDLGNWTVVSSP